MVGNYQDEAQREFDNQYSTSENVVSQQLGYNLDMARIYFDGGWSQLADDTIRSVQFEGYPNQNQPEFDRIFDRINKSISPE